jgi:hypothetical protein
MKHNFYTIVASLILVSCYTPRYAAPYTQQEDRFSNNGDPITQSLFNDKSSTISEENIQKILDGKYKLPQQLRVAVVKVENDAANRRYYWNDEEYLKTQQSYVDLFEKKINPSSKSNICLHNS